MGRQVTIGARPRPETGARSGRLRGLDGVRALAVLAVLAFHAGLPGAPGGFLGVEIFFVLSGFLITGLLLDERARSGRIRLKAFWGRRARRLLPAVYLMIVLTLLGFAVGLPGQVAQIRSDALAGLGYVTNWWLILRHQSYFQSFGRPSPFTHLWSLAIEEQFYLLWPAVLVLALPRLRKRWIAWGAAAAAAASACAMGLLFAPGSDPSLVYYSSETRASGLLFGAAAALAFWPALTARRPAGPGGGAAAGKRGPKAVPPSRWPAAAAVGAQVAGWACLAALVACCVRFGEDSTLLYRGGFTLVDALSVTLLCVVVAQPGGPLTRALDHPVPRWLGLRSYGIYVWHWPIFVVTRPGVDLPGGVWLALAVRLAATGLVAEASYRYLEVPVRSGLLGRWWAELRGAGRTGVQRWGLPAAAGASLLLACSATAVAVAQARPARPPSYLAKLTPVHGVLPAPRPTASGRRPPIGPTVPARPATPPARDAAPAVAAPAGCPVSAVGDSVMLGALPALRHYVPALRVVDAQVGMQVQQAISLLRRRAHARQLGCAVIVQVGNNGPLTGSEVSQIMHIAGSRRLVLLVNDHVPRPWEVPNDRLLGRMAHRWPNAVLVNWAGYSQGHQHLFYPDDTHLDPFGQVAYAQLIAAALHRSLV